ncbi:MAG: bifunctional folylpolyglutamate synthase/dihydrofolate synthase [Gemmatimonadetes bacterium]|nr:bifunctional folylpolyglutamate synthase/dihydrofolate synthase [Gemmatimonadota bacterium]
MLARSPSVIEWSLRPTQAILERLGHPERQFPVVHVGGTNGKGSVCHLVYRTLRQAGFRVGLYTSPHLVDVRERFIADERPIPEDAFSAWVDAILPAVEESGASFFEATTAVAFADFAARGVDIAVIEVGLGGRLDATNVVEPLVSVVTQIARDHTDYLGESLAGIAREKAGIAKPDRPLIIGETNPDLVGVMAEVARAAGARVVTVAPEARYGQPLGLYGPFQRRNAAIAKRALEELPSGLRPSDECVSQAFAATSIPGRFDVRGKWIFDVAHNSNGVDAMLEALAELQPRRPVHALVAILRDKDWRPMLRKLRHAVDRVWLTEPPTAPDERRWNLSEVVAAVGPDFLVQSDFERALQDVQSGAARVLVTGSFHTVGDALARLPGFAPLG